MHRFAPRKRRRIRRAAILFAAYATSFAVASGLHLASAEVWARKAALLTDVLGVLVAIDLVAIFLFDVLLLALRIDLADIVHDLARGGAYVLAGVSLLHRSGMQLSGIIATSAVLTVVLGFSLQATLGNVLGGVALQLDDSLHVGDWVQLSSGVQGCIKAVRWRHTVLETRNWDTLIVPNSTLLTESITLLGQREDRPVQHRMWVYFHVDYRYAPDEVIRVVDEALQATPMENVASDPRPHCLCTDLAREHAGGVAVYAARYWLTDLALDDPSASEVRVRIYAALKRAGIPLALPGEAVFVSHDDEEHAARKEAREMARRVSALEAVDLFAGISGEQRLALAQKMRLAPFGKGEVITRQGAEAHWLYLLVRGQVEVRLCEGAAEKLVARLEAPDVFGEMGVLTGDPRSASVVATSEVECYRVDKEAVRALAMGRAELAEGLSSIMVRRRMELLSVREGLDEEARRQRASAERSRLLSALQGFFGLGKTGS